MKNLCKTFIHLLPLTLEIMRYDIDSDSTNSVKGYEATNKHLRNCVVTF